MRIICKLEGQCLSEKLLLNGRVADLAMGRKNTLAKTSYAIDAYLCLAMLHAWTLEYRHDDALRLMVDTHEGRKPTTSWRRPPGRPCNVWLNKVREDANALPLYTLWRYEIARGRGSAQRSTRTTRQR